MTKQKDKEERRREKVGVEKKKGKAKKCFQLRRTVLALYSHCLPVESHAMRHSVT
jgi:hypothetical protein